jgi:hypothetical protein
MPLLVHENLPPGAALGSLALAVAVWGALRKR